MMNAIELLSTTTATLEEIAQRVGYGSEAAFSSAFKREMGVAPGAYRRGRATVNVQSGEVRKRTGVTSRGQERSRDGQAAGQE